MFAFVQIQIGREGGDNGIHVYTLSYTFIYILNSTYIRYLDLLGVNLACVKYLNVQPSDRMSR